jgi:hypothetical protein
VRQISRDKTDRLPRATAEFTTSALDGYGLRCHWPARPPPYALYPVLVHRLAPLLHASFRPRLAMTPLRFAITSPPSGCEEDFHLQAVNHARRTNKTPCPKTGRRYLPKPKLDDLGEDDDQREQHQRFDKRQSKNQRHLDRWTRSWVSCHGFACRSTHPALS